MVDARAERLRAIADLIRSRPIANQEELAAGLTQLGYTVTQATVSRDLEQLGAIKVRRNGTAAYALPDERMGSPAGPQLRSVIREFVRSIDIAGNLVVLKTPPGSAHLIGVALDRAPPADVAGTICGDDTVFVAVRNAERAPALAREFDDMRG